MEILDIYDSNRMPTGRTFVRGTKPEGGYYLVAQVIVFNTKGQMLIQQRQAQLRHAAALADSLSPYRVLGRGYAMVYDSKGRLCSADVLATGDKLTLRGAAHAAECTVTSVEELNESTQKL